MKVLENTEYFNVFSFKLNALCGSKDLNDIFEQKITAIDFKYNQKDFLSYFNRNRIKVDFYYDMNEKFYEIKDLLKDKDVLKMYKNKELVIKAFNENKEILLYTLKIKDIININLFPSKIDYSNNGRLFYKIEITCEQI
jgi:hypothetical protein